MLFCQLGGRTRCAKSSGAWRAAKGGLAHLGDHGAAADPRSRMPTRIGRGSCIRPSFTNCSPGVRRRSGARKFRFKNKLLSLDATMIELCAEMFPWATFRRTKGAVKLHFTLDHDGYLPTVLVITEGKRRETPVARQQTVCARHDPGV